MLGLSLLLGGEVGVPALCALDVRLALYCIMVSVDSVVEGEKAASQHPEADPASSEPEILMTPDLSRGSVRRLSQIPTEPINLRLSWLIFPIRVLPCLLFSIAVCLTQEIKSFLAN